MCILYVYMLSTTKYAVWRPYIIYDTDSIIDGVCECRPFSSESPNVIDLFASMSVRSIYERIVQYILEHILYTCIV